MTSKTPLVLLPGLLCDAELWRYQKEYLADIADIYVPDLTGFESIHSFGEHVLSKVPDQFALAGLSMGGYIALEIMRLAPGRVQKLALINTTSRPDNEVQMQRRHNLISLAKLGKFKGVTHRLLPLLVYNDHIQDPVISQTVFDMAERVGVQAFIRQQTAIMGRMDSRPYLPEIKCPVLLIGGHHDQLTPPECQLEISNMVPNADITILAKCGHLAPLEQPDKVNVLMRQWLLHSV